MKQWYYLVGEEQNGPVEEAVLTSLAQAGSLDANTLIWAEGMEEWTRLGDVQGLGVTVGATEPIPSTETIAPKGPIFLHIPVTRLVVLSILSAGLYEVYWIYKNWRYLKERDGLEIWPFWRGIFGVFYCHSLLRAIRYDSQANALEKADFSPGWLAAGWIIFTVVYNGLGRLESSFVYLAGMLLFFPSFLFLVPVQQYINRVNAKIQPTPPFYPWSAGHIVCILFGVVLFWLPMLFVLLVILLVMGGFMALD